MTPQQLLQQFGPREAMDYDVVIVGGGLGRPGHRDPPEAARRRHLGGRAGEGSEPGAHILSGAVMDPRALTELLPGWKQLGAPLNQPVTGDDVLFLSECGSRRMPDWLVPRNLHNEGCYVVQLGHVVKWLAGHAESLGVEIFPGFAAAEVLYDEQGRVKGVATGNQGWARTADPPTRSSSAWCCTAGTRSSPKAPAATSAASCSPASSSPRARMCRASPRPEGTGRSTPEALSRPRRAHRRLAVERGRLGGGFLYHLRRTTRPRSAS